MTADLLLLARLGVDGGQAATGAVAVTDGRISALGDAARATTSTSTEVLDLGDAVVRPGFGDGHVHPLWGGIELGWAPIRDCTSVEQVVEAVRLHAAANPDDSWVLGGSYDPALAAGGLFDARWLDAAVRGPTGAARVQRPPLRLGQHRGAAAVRHHGGDRRSAGLADRPSSGRQPVGHPRGVGGGRARQDGTCRSRTRPNARAGLRASTRLLAAAGITWAQEAAASTADLATYLAAAVDGDLAVRVNVALRAEPGRWAGQLQEFVAARASTDGVDLVSARTIKFFADGIIEAGSAALLEPYADAPGHLRSAGLGSGRARGGGRGLRLGTASRHTSTPSATPAYALLSTPSPTPSASTVRATADLSSRTPSSWIPADLPRFASLGVVANFEPLWMCLEPGMTELTLPRLGNRSSIHYPTGALSRLGVHLSFGSDWPVSSLRPLDGLAVAVTRQTADGVPASGWTPEERLSVHRVPRGVHLRGRLPGLRGGALGAPRGRSACGPRGARRRPDDHGSVGVARHPGGRYVARRPAYPRLTGSRHQGNRAGHVRVRSGVKRWLGVLLVGVTVSACTSGSGAVAAPSDLDPGFTGSSAAAERRADLVGHVVNRRRRQASRPTTGVVSGVARLYGGPARSDGKQALNGEPGGDIRVHVLRHGKVVVGMVTGEDGRFSFVLPPGRYVVTGCLAFTVVVRAGVTSSHDLTCAVP